MSDQQSETKFNLKINNFKVDEKLKKKRDLN